MLCGIEKCSGASKVASSHCAHLVLILVCFVLAAIVRDFAALRLQVRI